MQKITIKDNEMTDELRKKANAIISKTEKLSMKERHKYFAELDSIRAEILNNKNKNFTQAIKDFQDNKKPSIEYISIQIINYLNKETEEYIEIINNLLTKQTIR